MARIFVENMTKTLTDRERSFCLNIPSFSLQEGDKKAIVGATGSGKTTAIDLLALASRPQTSDYFELIGDEFGTIDVSAKAIRRENGRLAQLRAHLFGYVVQTSPLFSFLTVKENVAVQQKLAGRRDDDYIMALLQAVGLGNDGDAHPKDLSIGQRQRTAIARALAHRPAFLMCDEPTGALDDETANICMEMITSVAEYTGTAIVMITHDVGLATRHGFSLVKVERENIKPGFSQAILYDAISEVSV